jgi:hypothetical protein
MCFLLRKDIIRGREGRNGKCSVLNARAKEEFNESAGGFALVQRILGFYVPEYRSH